MATEDLIQIDGAEGEGGGQMVRTALCLSVLTGRPFEITRIRGGRQRPGLLRQHLTAVQAAARVGAAHVEGAELHSNHLVFRPQMLVPGVYRFAVGTAGSATLVCQTVLPALLAAEGESHVTFEGGTHNPMAPPWDFLDRVFLPLLEVMGAPLERHLERPGFYPAGGGRFRMQITPPSGGLKPIDLVSRPEAVKLSARVLTAHLPRHIGDREVHALMGALDIKRPDIRVVNLRDVLRQPANAIIIEAEAGSIREQFIGIGRKGRSAEAVVEAAVAECRAWLESGVPVGPHLADQLILPLALAGGGSFLTSAPTQHTRSQVESVRRFLEVPMSLDEVDEGRWRFAVGASR